MMISEKNKFEKYLGGLSVSFVFHVGLAIAAVTLLQQPTLEESGDYNITVDYQRAEGVDPAPMSLSHAPMSIAPTTPSVPAAPQAVISPPAQEKAIQPLITPAIAPHKIKPTPIAKGKSKMTSKQESQPTPSLAKMESETERDLREEVLKEQNDSLIATAPIPEPYEELTPLPAPVPLTQSQPDRMAPTPVAVAPPTPAPTAVQSAIASPSPSERTQGQGLEASPLATTMATAPSSGSGEQIASGLNPGLGNGYGPIRDDHVLRPLSGNQPPVYPSEDRLKRNAGEIVFRYFVNTDGTVKDIQIERGTGHKSLDLAALKAMKSWRYFPGQQGWARKGFHFNLSGEVETFHTRGRGLQMTASQPTEAGL